jgi:hypothetical protein
MQELIHLIKEDTFYFGYPRYDLQIIKYNTCENITSDLYPIKNNGYYYYPGPISDVFQDGDYEYDLNILKNNATGKFTISKGYLDRHSYVRTIKCKGISVFKREMT